ncbi:MAG TPA: hypothetical protein DCP31_18305 [Cyanobacteria bacterium UBA8543]|nr:hypothetical protein [Cyanobacteria bacterium UBA8543]
MEEWDQVDNHGAENEEVVAALNDAWTAAILCAELTSEEQVDIRINLETWQDEWDANFEMCLEALQQGWDYLPLQRVLQGEITQRGVWDREPPDYADNLALIRLQILERQQRYQEYLYLAGVVKSSWCVRSPMSAVMRIAPNHLIIPSLVNNNDNQTLGERRAWLVSPTGI